MSRLFLPIDSDFLIGAIFALFLLVIAVIDFKSRMIYNKILFPMGAVGIFLDFFCLLIPIEEAVINAAFGFVVMFAIMKLSRDGLGGGDVKFCAVLGLWLGDKLFSAIFIASATAALIAIFYLLKDKNLKMQLPFAPFLSFGSWFVF